MYPLNTRKDPGAMRIPFEALILTGNADLYYRGYRLVRTADLDKVAA